MNMRTKTLFVVLALLFLFLLSLPVFAGGDDLTNTSKNILEGNSSADVAGDSIRSYAFSGSLGDVDINECLASSQWGILVFNKQKLEENPWCQSVYLDAIGAHEAAARVRCMFTETLQAAYPDIKKCQAAVMYARTAENHTQVPLSQSEPTQDEDEEDSRRLDALQARLTAIEDQRKADAEKARRAQIVARQAAEKAKAESERRARARAILEKE